MIRLLALVIKAKMVRLPPTEAVGNTSQGFGKHYWERIDAAFKKPLLNLNFHPPVLAVGIFRCTCC